MFCTSCGTRVKDGSKFCTECGAPVPATASAGKTVRMDAPRPTGTKPAAKRRPTARSADTTPARTVCQGVQPVTVTPHAGKPRAARSTASAPIIPTPRPTLHRPQDKLPAAVAIVAAVLIIGIIVLALVAAHVSSQGAANASAGTAPVAQQAQQVTDAPDTSASSSADAQRDAYTTGSGNETATFKVNADNSVTCDEYGISLQMPAGYTPSVSQDSLHLTKGAIDVSVFARANTDGTSLNDAYASLKSSSGANGDPAAYTTKGTGWCVVSRDRGDGTTFYTMEYVTPDKVCSLTFDYPTGTSEGDSLIEQVQPTFKVTGDPIRASH